MKTTESGEDDSEGDGCCSWSVLFFCVLTLGVALALALEVLNGADMITVSVVVHIVLRLRQM